MNRRKSGTSSLSFFYTNPIFETPLYIYVRSTDIDFGCSSYVIRDFTDLIFGKYACTRMYVFVDGERSGRKQMDTTYIKLGREKGEVKKKTRWILYKFVSLSKTRRHALFLLLCARFFPTREEWEKWLKPYRPTFLVHTFKLHKVVIIPYTHERTGWLMVLFPPDWKICIFSKLLSLSPAPFFTPSASLRT